MQIICCYGSRLQPEAAEAIAKYAPDAEFCQTKGLYGYCDVIEARWTGTDDLVVIEGDKVITAEVLPSFAACGQPWCASTYKLQTYGYQIGLITAVLEARSGLGCTRFSAALQREVPAEEFLHDDGLLWPPCPFCEGAGCWNYLDLRMTEAIQHHGYLVCNGHGSVEHKHEYPRVTKSSEIQDFKLRSDIQAMEALAGPAWPYRDV